jgi:hypothetical protein
MSGTGCMISNLRPTVPKVQDSDKSQYPPHYYILVRLWGKLVTQLPNPIFNKRHKKCITLGKKSQLSALSTFAIFWLHTNLANQGLCAICTPCQHPKSHPKRALHWNEQDGEEREGHGES